MWEKSSVFAGTAAKSRHQEQGRCVANSECSGNGVRACRRSTLCCGRVQHDTRLRRFSRRLDRASRVRGRKLEKTQARNVTIRCPVTEADVEQSAFSP